MSILLDSLRFLASFLALPLVLLAVVGVVLGWHRHTKRDWLLALSLLVYFPAIVAYGAISERRVEAGHASTFWHAEAMWMAVVVLLIQSAASIWFAKSRLLVASMAPLAVSLAIVAAMVSEMSVNNVWF